QPDIRVQRLGQPLNFGVDDVEHLDPLRGPAAVLVSRVIESFLISVHDRWTRLAGLDNCLQPFPAGVDADIGHTTLSAARQSRIGELMIVDNADIDPGGGDALEHRRVRLPAFGIDILIPCQSIQSSAGLRNTAGVSDYTVDTGSEARAQ